MDAITPRGCDALDFQDFDSLAEALDDAEVELDALEHALSDDLGPHRRQRVTSYAGSPGAFVSCPGCGIGGKRVNGRGAYSCEACGFTNTEGPIRGALPVDRIHERLATAGTRHPPTPPMRRKTELIE